jgi:hypothetical protein
MLHQEWNMGIDEAIEAEAQAQAICMATGDFRRAYEAFVATSRRRLFEGRLRWPTAAYLDWPFFDSRTSRDLGEPRSTPGAEQPARRARRRRRRRMPRAGAQARRGRLAAPCVPRNGRSDRHARHLPDPRNAGAA